MLLPDDPFNPITGEGTHDADRRVRIPTPLPDLPTALVPASMADDPQLAVATSPDAWEKLRCRHDFEYWCVRCVRIYDKLSRANVPFRLNRAQRRVLAVLEEQRLARRPIRIIILKARQWGCSTLIQMYMAWIQSCHRRNWNSLICAHVKDSAANIRGMYTSMLSSYPEDLWEGDVMPAFKPFERAINIREITGRGCRVTIASAENHDAIRGGDFAMAHLSEVAFWGETGRRSPEAFIRAVCGSVTIEPLTLIAMESTANGVGNFFHTEWLRCSSGRGDKAAVFIPWYDIEIYRAEVPDPEALLKSLTPYERALLDKGISLEQIAWYHHKSLEYGSAEQMQAEFPSDPIEAFANTGRNVFANEGVEALRRGCSEPVFCGEVRRDGTPAPGASRPYKIWENPRRDLAYVVAVDVGGRSSASDFSVIAVLTREPVPRVVAQWRGHCDHDLLVDFAIGIASAYNRALLVVESNTLESEADDTSDPSLFILSRLCRRYSNVYFRPTNTPGTPGRSFRPGFHTNRATKTMIITELIEAVREGGYVEADTDACNELATYRLDPSGRYAAAPGYHDDILMTRAIALHVILSNPPCHASTEPDTQHSITSLYSKRSY